MSNAIAPVTIQVLGKEYRIGCSDEERPDLLESARYLDQKMREIKETGRVVGAERIAVLAALNITHELAQNQKRSFAPSPDFSDRLIRIQQRIDQVLADCPGMD